VRIGIDATWAARAGTGTSTYTIGLVEALVRQFSHDYVLYFQSGDQRTNPLYEMRHQVNEYRVTPAMPQLARNIPGLSVTAARDKLDVFHSPTYFLPLWSGRKVATFHDANMFSEWRTWWRKGMKLSWLSLALQSLLSSRTAGIVMTDSYASKDALSRIMRVPDNKLAVAYPGVPDFFFALPTVQELEAAQKLVESANFLLYVGVLSPQKNIEGIVRAFALGRRGDQTLVLVGREDGAYYREVIVPLCRNLGVMAYVRVTGLVSNVVLRALYHQAQVFVFPSFAEGFGLPPLEAMACGTPVVAAPRSSLPEVLGSAAMYADPNDSESIAGTVSSVLNDEALRRTLVLRGTERARSYTWSHTARAVNRIHESFA